MEISGANRLSSDPATLETRRSEVRERNAAASPKFQWNTTAPADSRIAYRRNGYRKAAREVSLIEKGGVLEMFCRINLDYFEGYTVTGVTHGHDGHIQPREWVLGLSGMSLRYLLCTRPLEAVTKLEPFWPVTPEPAPQRQSERTFMTLTHPLLVYWG